jgi:hypothetical protein
MPVGFYELLQVAPDAPPEAIRAAWQEQVALVVRKLRAAEARQQDIAGIEARRTALAEAWAILSDPMRRRRYDRFRELARTGLPADPEELWAQAHRSLVDPAAAAAMEVIRMVTDLRVGEAPGVPAPPPEPEVTPVQTREVAPVREEVRPEPAPPSPGPRRPTEARAAPVPGLPLDRTVSNESLARLFEQYGPSGAYLAAVREMRRVSLDELSTTTRITRRFLDAMERDAYTELPGATFVRGYVKMVLRALEALDGPELDEFVEGYMSRFHRARG